jgi:hypothetical protein
MRSKETAGLKGTRKISPLAGWPGFRQVDGGERWQYGREGMNVPAWAWRQMRRMERIEGHPANGKDELDAFLEKFRASNEAALRADGQGELDGAPMPTDRQIKLALGRISPDQNVLANGMPNPALVFSPEFASEGVVDWWKVFFAQRVAQFPSGIELMPGLNYFDERGPSDRLKRVNEMMQYPERGFVNAMARHGGSHMNREDFGRLLRLNALDEVHSAPVAYPRDIPAHSARHEGYPSFKAVRPEDGVYSRLGRCSDQDHPSLGYVEAQLAFLGEDGVVVNSSTRGYVKDGDVNYTHPFAVAGFCASLGWEVKRGMRPLKTAAPFRTYPRDFIVKKGDK